MFLIQPSYHIPQTDLEIMLVIIQAPILSTSSDREVDRLVAARGSIFPFAYKWSEVPPPIGKLAGVLFVEVASIFLWIGVAMRYSEGPAIQKFD